MCLNKYCVRLTLIFFAAFLVGCVNDDTEGDKNVNNYVSEGDEVPAFVLTSNEGTTLASSSLSGKVYILNFFDTSCPDCQQELKVLQKIYEKYGETVPVLNVPRSQKPEEVTAYWQQTGLTVPFYSDGDQGLYYKFASRIVPRTYIVSADGKVCNSFTDNPIASFDTLDSLLHKLLKDKGGDVNISLKLNIPAQESKISVDHESKVSKLELFFFDSATKNFFDKLTISYDDLNNHVVIENDGTVTHSVDQLRIKAGKFDIFAIANYDYTPNTDMIRNESDLLDIVDNITYKDGIVENVSDKGPVMTSRVTSLLGIDMVPYINRQYDLVIDFQRVLAKLSITVKFSPFHLSYANINITNYRFVNINTSYYLFQHIDYLPEFIARTDFNLYENYGDYNDEGDSYVIDPYFYKKVSTSSAMYEVGSAYRNWYGYFETPTRPMPSPLDTVIVYALDNTVFKISQKNGYTPGVVFKGSVNPTKGVYFYNANDGLKLQQNRASWPTTIYLYNNEFYGSIEAIKFVNPSISLDPLKSDYTDAELLTYAIKQCKASEGIYETYYTYWIRHRNSSPDSMGPMEYGIVRNFSYDMTLESITGLGNSIITPEILRDNYPNSYKDIVINP